MGPALGRRKATAKDSGPLPRYPSRAERQAAKHERRAQGRQLTTEDRLAYAVERSASDHDFEQQRLRAVRRDDEQPLDLLNISAEGRIEFARLHDAVMVDEAGVPRLRPDFLRYLDDVAAEATLTRKANGNGNGTSNGDGASGPGDAQETRTVLLDAWAGLAQVEPAQCNILYLVHVEGRSQSTAAEELGMDRMVLAKQAAEGRAWLKGFIYSRAAHTNGHALPVSLGMAGASGVAIGLVVPAGA